MVTKPRSTHASGASRRSVPAQALVIFPLVDRPGAEELAAHLRERFPRHSVVVSDGEAGAYLNTATGEAGYRIVLRGPWQVVSTTDGEVILTCESDAQPASVREV